MPNLNERPLLVVRESKIAQVIWLIIFTSVLILSLWFAMKKSFPLPVLIMGGGSLFLIICIQLALLKKAMSNDNWLLKFFSEGLLIQITGYVQNEDTFWIYIPRSAIRQVLVETEKRRTIQLDVNRIRKNTLLQRFTFLNIQVDKNKIQKLSPNGGVAIDESIGAPTPTQRRTNRLDQMKSPNRRAGLKMSFIFNPIRETDLGFQIELRSHRTRTTPSLKALAEYFGCWGISLKTHDVVVELSNTVSEDVFRKEIRRICKQGFEMEARGAIRLRYRAEGIDTTAKLEEILESSAQQGEPRDTKNDC